MPKYSSVQAYTDTNANLQTVSYERAKGGKGGGGDGGVSGSGGGEKSKTVKPEAVVNPYGSTAGAHSGEFHIYRKTRNREMLRMAAFHEADAERAKDEEFHDKLQHEAEQLERKTSKKRAKRQKSKEAKVRRKNLAHAGIAITTADSSEQQQEDVEDDDDVINKDKDDEEFPMIPLPAATTGETAMGDQSLTISKVVAANAAATTSTTAAASSPAQLPPIAFANDGSFLEMAQKKLAVASELPTTTTTSKPVEEQE